MRRRRLDLRTSRIHLSAGDIQLCLGRIELRLRQALALKQRLGADKIGFRFDVGGLCLSKLGLRALLPLPRRFELALCLRRGIAIVFFTDVRQYSPAGHDIAGFQTARPDVMNVRHQPGNPEG